MPRPDFSNLEYELLRAGTAPFHVRRIVSELSDHFDDLVEARRAEGFDLHNAERRAGTALGDLQNVAIAIKQVPQLKSWAWRWPRLALLVYPLACAVALPAAPLIAGAQNAGQVMRWIACVMLGAFVTAAMFLLLQLSITFS